MALPIPAPASFRTGAGPRALGLGLALLIEALLLLVLFSFGPMLPGRQDRRISVFNFDVEPPKPPPEPPPRPEARERPHPVPPEQAPPPGEPQAMRLPSPVLPPPTPATPVAPEPSAPPASIAAAPDGDSDRVGILPGGEPLYAAAWYRPVRVEDVLRHLKSDPGPGWAVIACRTVPRYRIRDCVLLEAHPAGTRFAGAVIAASRTFRVRPPRRGDAPLVGSWVRIKVVYGKVEEGKGEE